MTLTSRPLCMKEEVIKRKEREREREPPMHKTMDL